MWSKDRAPNGLYELTCAGKIKGEGTNCRCLLTLQSFPITKGIHLQGLLALMILMNHRIIVRLAEIHHIIDSCGRSLPQHGRVLLIPVPAALLIPVSDALCNPCHDSSHSPFATRYRLRGWMTYRIYDEVLLWWVHLRIRLKNLEIHRTCFSLI